MASGYIGKISAVVTANTSDLSRKLQGSVKDVDKFAKAIQKSVNGSATQAQQSLERIFTPLQSLERKLRASLSKTLDLNLPVDKIRALVSAAEQINKPLERAAKQFNQLSVEVQSGFFPALQRAQDAAVGVNNAIESTGSVSAKSFNQAKVQVDAVTQALSRLSQAQALAGRSLTGGELQFKNPLLFQTLSASAATTQKAGDLSANTLADGAIAKQVQALGQYQQAAIRAQSQLESLDLNPNVSPDIIEAQKRRIENLIETARRAQEQLQRTIDIEKNVGAASQFMSTKDPSGRTIQQRLSDISNQSIQEAEKALVKGQQTLGRKIANGFLTILTEEQAAADTVVARQQELGRRIGNGFLTIITEEEAAADTVVARQQELGRRIGNGFLTIITEEAAAADTIAARQQELGRRIGNGFLTILTEEEAAADTLGARQQELGRRIGNGFLTIITEEEAAADTIASRQQALGRRIANGFLNILTPMEAAADTFQGRRSSSANDFRRGFGGPGTAGLQFGADQAELRRYNAELAVLQQSISRVSAQARGPAVGAFEKYRLAIAKAFEAGTLSSRSTQRELARLQQQAISSAAAVANVSKGALSRSVAQAGDIGRRGFDNFALAANQAAFAIDDFFSSTGGLEFKLRAVQNNLTQLGFIVGGTAGLFTALGVAIGGQLLIALGKAIGAIDDTAAREERLRKISDIVTESTNKQAQAVENLTKAYEAFSARATAALTEVQRQQKGLREEFTNIRQEQEQQRQGEAGAIDPQLIRTRSRIKDLEKQLESQGPADRIGTQIQLIRARAQEQARVAQIEQEAARISGGNDINGIRGLLRVNQRAITEAQALEERQRRLFVPVTAPQEILRLLGERAVLTTAARQSQGNEATAAARLLEGVTQQASALQVRAGDAGSSSIAEAIGEQVQKVQFAFDTFTKNQGQAGFFGFVERAAAEASAALSVTLPESLRIFEERANRSAEALRVFEESAKRGDSARQGLQNQSDSVGQTVRDIVASFEQELLTATAGRPADIERIRNEQQGVLAAFAGQQRRQVAPTLFALQDSVANSVLLGPSRAALNTADITTQQGAAELARLIRGDDASRNQNLLELQKQTAELVKLNTSLENQGVAD